VVMELESLAFPELAVELVQILDADEAPSVSRRRAGRSLCCL
jgi:hypothetical protein